MYRNGLKLIENCANSFPSGLCLGSLEHYVDLIPLTVFIDCYLVIVLTDDSGLL